MSVRVEHGDCLEVMPRLLAEGVRVDSVVCDPPYHLTSIVKRFGAETAAPAQFGKDGAYARASRGFMGQQWDGGDVAFRPDTWRLAFDLLKPGGYIFAFSSSRTYHRMACAIEDAGFITHPMHGWIFGQGFPKAHRLDAPDTGHLRYGQQAIKPALEPIYMGQKPMEGTGTENWLKHGTGALNIDGCRIATNGEDSAARYNGKPPGGGNGNIAYAGKMAAPWSAPKGRWPANVIHDGSDEVLAAFAAYGERPSAGGNPREKVGSPGVCYSPGITAGGPKVVRNDTGTAARFFYCAKASKKDRAGSKHPTVKPLALMRYLCRLVTPPGGLVLDPFAGSGTTLQAALEEGFRAIGIEREAEYVADIRRRLGHVAGADTPLFANVPSEDEWTRSGMAARNGHDSYYEAVAEMRKRREAGEG